MDLSELAELMYEENQAIKRRIEMISNISDTDTKGVLMRNLVERVKKMMTDREEFIRSLRELEEDSMLTTKQIMLCAQEKIASDEPK